MRRIVFDEASKQKIRELLSVKGSDFYFSMIDDYHIRLALVVENNFNTDFYTDDFKDYLTADFTTATDEAECGCIGRWFKMSDFYNKRKDFIKSMLKAKYVEVNLLRLKLEPTNEEEDFSSNYAFNLDTSFLQILATKSFETYTPINTDCVIPFVKKFGPEVKQIFKISRKNNQDMIFTETDGAILYKIFNNLYEEDGSLKQKLFFSYYNAEKIKYYHINSNWIFWFDENKELIKANNFIEMDEEQNIFNVEKIGDDKLTIDRKEIADVFDKISKVSFSDLSFVKLKFNKTKLKVILSDDLSVDNLTIDVPVKSKLTTGNMVLSAEYLKKFLKVCEAETIDIALFREELLRIECDDVNMFLSVREDH